MAPNMDTNKQQVSFPKLKYPLNRDMDPRTVQQWMAGKYIQDGAEGLWRIHDSLYDFSDFVAKHPGGPRWISVTKGTDITEAFETHHLKGIAEGLLPKYFVRKTMVPRNYPFTFHENGFYKTLKARIMETLRDVTPVVKEKSHNVTNILLVAFIVLLTLTSRSWMDSNWILGVTLTLTTSYVLSALITCGHNYLHQADNWRMYLVNFSGMTHDDWRISHAMSHHMHTNTAQDLELSMLEPVLIFIPYKHKRIFEQLAAFYWPIIFMFIFLGLLVKEIFTSLTHFEGKKLTLGSFIPFTVPSWIWLTGGLSVQGAILQWIVITMIASLIFNIYGLTAGHHSHVNFFECDVPREEYLDWGLHQLDTMVERIDFAGDHFRSLTRFGDHVLHHLFPTLDHAYLNHLYPILFEHMEKFNIPIRTTTFTRALLSHSKQLVRKRPNDFTSEKTRPKHVSTPFNKEHFLAELKNK